MRLDDDDEEGLRSLHVKGINRWCVQVQELQGSNEVCCRTYKVGARAVVTKLRQVIETQPQACPVRFDFLTGDAECDIYAVMYIVGQLGASYDYPQRTASAELVEQ